MRDTLAISSFSVTRLLEDMKLNYHFAHPDLSDTTKSYPPALLIHGLFGNLDNLGNLARDLVHDRSVLQVDLRNHGLSPHAPEMNYDVMVQDIEELLDELAIEQLDVIGHSMGGKVAMALASHLPQRVHRLVLLDISPVVYPVRRHDAMFKAINAVSEAKINNRTQAAACMRQYMQEEGVIQFLLKSFNRGEWRFNVAALWDNYDEISGWNPIPPYRGETLFIKGGNSSYIQAAYRDAIAEQFPCAHAHIVAGTGHWLHGEKPVQVLRAIHRFLDDGAYV